MLAVGKPHTVVVIIHFLSAVLITSVLAKQDGILSPRSRTLPTMFVVEPGPYAAVRFPLVLAENNYSLSGRPPPHFVLGIHHSSLMSDLPENPASLPGQLYIFAWFKFGFENFCSSLLSGSVSFLCAALMSPQRTEQYCPQIENVFADTYM